MYITSLNACMGLPKLEYYKARVFKYKTKLCFSKLTSTTKLVFEGQDNGSIMN
jgi:hypothetical protein